MQLKLLIALGLAQLALLVAIFFEISNQDSQPTVPAFAASSHAPVSGAIAGSPSQVGATAFDTELLRRVIRQELAVLNAAPANRDPAAVDDTASPQTDPGEAEERRLAVMDSISYYKSVGRISPSQMTRLQADIARLAPAHRREALADVVRALNSGQLQGAL